MLAFPWAVDLLEHDDDVRSVCQMGLDPVGTHRLDRLEPFGSRACCVKLLLFTLGRTARGSRLQRRVPTTANVHGC